MALLLSITQHRSGFLLKILKEYITSGSHRQRISPSVSIGCYKLYPTFNDIEHRKTQVNRSKTNGFVDRSNRTVLDVFLGLRCDGSSTKLWMRYRKILTSG